jgi:sodium/proline symporter
MMLTSFLFFLLVFLALGLYSATRSRGTKTDYYLASRAVSAPLVGLSAVATNNSGYMFIGVIGFTYATGLAAVWLMVGWIVGDFLASLVLYRRLRETTEATGEPSFAGVLSRWYGQERRALRTAAALLIVVFLGAYAAAQLAAGSKALHVLLGWHPRTGAVLSAGIVVLYCLAGGIRASIWTDAAQSLVMLGAMAVLLGAGVAGLGGPAAAWHALDGVPGFLDWFPPYLRVPGAIGMALFVAGWLFAGVSVIGQPHIVVRFMAIDRPASLWRARAYYYLFFTMFYAMATGVGLLARLYLPDLAQLDPELALPTMASDLLPPVLVGLTLAGIFAATLSTADSLILSCSAAVTHDLAPRRLERTAEIRGATLAVTALALGIALAQTHSVFSLVILAWSVLGSAFGPLLLVQARGGRVGEAHALAMMLAGAGTALAWRALGLHAQIYEGMPGILAGLAVYALAQGWRARRGHAAGPVASGRPRG